MKIKILILLVSILSLGLISPVFADEDASKSIECTLYYDRSFQNPKEAPDKVLLKENSSFRDLDPEVAKNLGISVSVAARVTEQDQKFVTATIRDLASGAKASATGVVSTSTQTTKGFNLKLDVYPKKGLQPLRVFKIVCE